MTTADRRTALLALADEAEAKALALWTKPGSWEPYHGVQTLLDCAGKARALAERLRIEEATRAMDGRQP